MHRKLGELVLSAVADNAQREAVAPAESASAEVGTGTGTIGSCARVGNLPGSLVQLLTYAHLMMQFCLAHERLGNHPMC